MNKISNHPVLQKDLDLKIFLESDSFALDVSNFVRVFLFFSGPSLFISTLAIF